MTSAKIHVILNVRNNETRERMKINMSVVQKLREENKKRINEEARALAEELGMTDDEIKTIMEIDHKIQAELETL